MEIYEELGTIQVEPYDTFTERLNEMVLYYGRILQILDDKDKMNKLVGYCKNYCNTSNYHTFLRKIRKLKENENV